MYIVSVSICKLSKDHNNIQIIRKIFNFIEKHIFYDFTKTFFMYDMLLFCYKRKLFKNRKHFTKQH